MKILGLIIMLSLGSQAGAHEMITLEPGECVVIYDKNICAKDLSWYELNYKKTSGKKKKIKKIEKFCSLEKWKKEPQKMMVLYQMITFDNGKIQKTALQAFPVWEKDKCEAAAQN